LRVLYVPLHAALTSPTAAAAERPPLALPLAAAGEAEQPGVIAAAFQHMTMQLGHVQAGFGALGAYRFREHGIARFVGGRVLSR